LPYPWIYYSFEGVSKSGDPSASSGDFTFKKSNIAMKAKDRLTAICCTNAVGDKVPIVCIGKSKNP
tara:strand:+ start:225 stop:422 length:198 start_codon:yes stop_codon:yes gene_type:complete